MLLAHPSFLTLTQTPSLYLISTTQPWENNPSPSFPNSTDRPTSPLQKHHLHLSMDHPGRGMRV